LSVIIQRNP
jgi:hypothetical protein